MSDELARIHQPDAAIAEDALKRAEEMIEEEEGVQNKFTGRMAAFVTLVAVAMSLFHLYASYEIVRTEVLRATHVAFVLFLTFLIFPVARRYRHRAREPVLDTLFLLDHLLGALQRLFADRRVGLMDAGFFAHRMTERSSISKCSVALGGMTPPPAPRSP